MDVDSLLTEAPRALEAWGISGATIAPVPGGTLNWNFRVDSGEGAYFLRCVRANLETERIVGEHALVQWVADRGIPAPVAIPTRDGATIALVGEPGEERRWALLPWMPGDPVERGTLNRAQARSVGAIHGRIQGVLADHPDSKDARMLMRWDKAQSLGLLDRLVEAARE